MSEKFDLGKLPQPSEKENHVPEDADIDVVHGPGGTEDPDVIEAGRIISILTPEQKKAIVEENIPLDKQKEIYELNKDGIIKAKE